MPEALTGRQLVEQLSADQRRRWQQGDRVGVESYLSGSASNAPVTVRFDAFPAVTAQ